ncbi:unnamed protein product [Adineta ricciae]|uniref:NAD(P)(+)--arginine ADP-ribosyltransferase n=1 Tax=Adineta ricciae TaxID=249248 RepID=A0A815TWM6_ADIRI|nr:unnamed protein product [Adineta ricciae]CAF1631107.1 unnamed protein product [Adineta ricciae]
MNRFGDIDYSLTRLPPVYGYHVQQLVSLEKSLELLQSQINGLNHFIKVAKQRCYYPNDYGLTHDESASIYVYTMEWGDESLYRLLNKSLRDQNRNALTIWFPYLKLFDTALDKLPNFKGNVWRGVLNDIGKNFKKDEKFTWWSFNSCSSSINIIKDFLKNEINSTIFLIEITNGKNISGFTDQEEENEIILKMGTDFYVKEDVLEHPKGSFHVHLIQIHFDDEQSLASAMNHLQIQMMKKEIQLKKWKQNAKIVAGGNGDGKKLNQLSGSQGIYVDKNQNIFIADYENDRIIQWRRNENEGIIVADGNGKGNRIDQLNYPIDMIVDEENNSVIIADTGNKRVMKWLFNQNQQEILIENILCSGLTKDKHGFIYVSDYEKNEVRKWKIGGKKGKKGILVAGGNGKGNQRNRLNSPTFIFVDNDQSIYVSDLGNHRVMKWRKDAREGIVVAGGNGKGNDLSQLSYPTGIIVDDFGRIYVADQWNDRIMRWSDERREGEIIVGGNGRGNELNQLFYPKGLSFDVEGNIYVSDCGNNRILRFDLISS